MTVKAHDDRITGESQSVTVTSRPGFTRAFRTTAQLSTEPCSLFRTMHAEPGLALLVVRPYLTRPAATRMS